MVDIGANLGSYTHTFARNGVETYSFEPNTETFGLLCSAVHLSEVVFPDSYGRVHLHNNGVTGRTGDWLKVSVDDVANRGDTSVSVSGDHSDSNSVLSVAIDDVIGDIDGNRVGMIKIDTQGFEPLVFEGAWKTIQKHRPMLAFEWWVDWMEDRTNMKPADILVKLKTFGYKRYNLVSHETQEINPEAESMRGIRDELYVAVPESAFPSKANHT